MWKWWPNWLMTNAQLVKENNNLRESFRSSGELVNSLNNTLNFNIVRHAREVDSLRNQTIMLLGAVALQHQGELLVKDDFMQMMTDPEYNLQLIVERNKENTGSILKAVEKALESKENVEPKE